MPGSFCIAPRGDSALTKRFYDAIVAGCIPVVISDLLMPAFEDLVSVKDAFVRITEVLFMQPSFSLLSHLRSLSATHVYQMQSRLACLRHFMSYGRPSSWENMTGLAPALVTLQLLQVVADTKMPPAL